MVTRRGLLKFSLVNLILGIAVLGIAYLCFHYVTDDGITLVWHPEAGKPFVTELIGNLGVLFIFSSSTSLVAALMMPRGK
jgi:hypothetical protein